MKDRGEVAVPFGVVTTTGPLVAPGGTVAETYSLEMLWKSLAGIPLKVTEVVPSRAFPQIVTTVPAGPLAGTSARTPGSGFGSPKSQTQALPYPGPPFMDAP